MLQADLDFKLLFENVPGLFLVLQPDPVFTILTASHAYVRATQSELEKMVGRPLFEVFPDNPDDPEATGTSNLRKSLERVLTLHKPDPMPVQKYDIRQAEEEGGGFVVRYWSPLNVPVLAAEGTIRYIIHRVEDVTEFVLARQFGQLQSEKTEALERHTITMEHEVLRRSQELDQVNQELRSANARLSELDQVKTVFFSNISHEFRTPLTLLLGPVEDALADLETPLPSVHQTRLELVHHNALRLLKLVNALLDFSRIEAGRMKASYTRTDISRLTSELANMFQSAVVSAGLELVVECAPLSEPAVVDPEMWEKIVLNLVSNALKFTFEGEITVRLRETDQAFVLTVADTGTGIPPHEIPRIFERFHRVEGGRSRTHEGTGIGLSLVKELVRLHGGDIQLQSELESGTTVTVTIPKGSNHLSAESVKVDSAEFAPSRPDLVSIAEAERWVSSQPNPLTPPQPFPKPAKGESFSWILLVEDNADLRRYLTELLATVSHVEAVPDGQAALEAARQRKPDLILSDIMMPRLDGFGLVREIRKDPALHSLPIILLSARTGETNTVEGLEAGADDYLVKPFSSRELLARIRTQLEMARSRRAWTLQLEAANQELEAFSYSVAHDLRAPLRAIERFSGMLWEDQHEKLDETGLHLLNLIQEGCVRMKDLIEDLLKLSHVNRMELKREKVNLTEMARKILADLYQRNPTRLVEVQIEPGLWGMGDARLLAIVLENLLGNSWKFTGKQASPRIRVGVETHENQPFFVVEDNGVGFDMKYGGKLFAPFQRLHGKEEFEGTGIGLAIVKRIIVRHEGQIRCEAEAGRGAKFLFSLGVA
ncbi:MAG: response regulator [Blastocatellia bacterium]|nr:response regulator [Blastocatellia bacterium]